MARPDELQVRRAEMHSALADPARVTIVDELRVSDRSPSELSALLGIAPSLVAFHLDTLERAALIERVVSSADRRRRYVRLLAGEIAQLSVQSAPPNGLITFVCTHNSARSQLAAAVWRDRGGRATSAGTDPAAAIHPGAIAAAARAHVELGNTTPRRFDPAGADGQVITVCDRAHEDLGSPPSWHWSIPDPAIDGTDLAFDRALDLIRARIGAVTTQETR